MQKVNHCAQKNEILVHKGHKHENHSKLCVCVCVNTNRT